MTLPYKRVPAAIMSADDIVFGPTVTLDADYLVVFDDSFADVDLSGAEWVDVTPQWRDWDDETED